MKIISNGWLMMVIGLLLTTIGQSQDKPKSGFIRLVNAVAVGTGQLDLSIDKASINSAGYKLGDVTGGISLKTGSHEVTIRREGAKPGTTKVIIGGNETTILIPFAEKVPASDTEPAHWQIRVLRLKQLDPESERSGTFVSVSQNPELRLEMRDPDGKWNAIFAKRLAVTQVPIRYPRGYVPIKIGDKDLESITISTPGNYVVVLYDDVDGVTKSLNFRDFKFLSAD